MANHPNRSRATRRAAETTLAEWYSADVGLTELSAEAQMAQLGFRDALIAIRDGVRPEQLDSLREFLREFRESGYHRSELDLDGQRMLTTAAVLIEGRTVIFDAGARRLRSLNQTEIMRRQHNQP
jgi:hypothetical protein